MSKDALALAEDVRAEALKHFHMGNELIKVSMLLDGRHASLPDGVRATEEELRARLTPEQRAELDRSAAAFAASRAAR